MRDVDDLKLYEQVLLLALHDEKGKLQGHLPLYAVAAAALAELLHDGRIELANDKYVEVRDGSPTGDPTTDMVLERLQAARRRARLSTWIQRIGGKRGLTEVAVQGLVADETVEVAERSFLGFRSIRYPEANPIPEQMLIARLEAALFSDDDPATVDEDACAVIALANPVGLLASTFGKTRLRGRKKRIKELTSHHRLGMATSRAVNEVTAAVAAATIGATAAAT